MSGFQGHDRDFSRYDHMSTEELENILRADFELQTRKNPTWKRFCT